MTAIANVEPRNGTASWHNRFLEMLPLINRHARFCARNLPLEARDEFVQATIALCFVTMDRLAKRHKLKAAYASALVRFAAMQIRQGRQVGGRLNNRDVLSGYAQHRNNFIVHSMDHRTATSPDSDTATAIADRRTPVDEQAAFQIDFRNWLTQLAPIQRQVAIFLAAGNSTSRAAREFRLSCSRVSQLRRELWLKWRQFHGNRCDPDNLPKTVDP